MLELVVTPPGVLPPNTPFAVQARLTNPAPNRPSVGYNIELSDNDGLTWSFAGGASTGASLATITTGTTTNCGRTRIYRARYTDCSFVQTIGSANVVSTGVLAAGSIDAPSRINPPVTYTVTASVSGTPGNAGFAEYSDDFGQTWIGLGSITGSGTFTVNASACPRLRIHRLRYTDFCNVPHADLSYSCCTSTPPAISASVTPASQHLICGNDYSFVVDAGNDYPTSAMQFQWRRNGVVISDGPTGTGSIIAGATTPMLSIRGAGKPDVAEYTCSVHTVCVSGVSMPGLLESCAADVDDGTFRGQCDAGVTVDDLLFYLFLFETGDARADVDDGSGTGALDGGVTIDDLLFFAGHFESGC